MGAADSCWTYSSQGITHFSWLVMRLYPSSTGCQPTLASRPEKAVMFPSKMRSKRDESSCAPMPQPLVASLNV